jgi:acyl carrier protein
VEKWTKFGCDLIEMKSAFPLIEATCAYPYGDIGINAVKDAGKIRNWFWIGGETDRVRPVEDRGRQSEDRGRQIEEIIERWEEDKIKGIVPDFGQIRESISVDEMNTMPSSLVDRIYNLCFEQQATIPHTAATSFDHMQIIREIIGEVLQLEKIDDDEPFQNYGLDSIKAMRLSTRLEKKMNRPVQPQWFIEFPTVIELSQHLNSINQAILI